MGLLPILLVALCLLLTVRSSFFVGFVSNPGGPFSVSGTVSVVSFGFIQDPTGLTITFTVDTFVNSGTATTINFCGDQRAKFPINRFLQADFNIGIHCSVLIAVTVVTPAHKPTAEVETANDFPISSKATISNRVIPYSPEPAHNCKALLCGQVAP